MKVERLEKDRSGIREGLQRALLDAVASKELDLEMEIPALEEVHPSLRFRPVVLVLGVVPAEHLASLRPLNFHAYALAQGREEKKKKKKQETS